MQAEDNVRHSPVLARNPAMREATRQTARAGEVESKGKANPTLGPFHLLRNPRYTPVPTAFESMAVPVVAAGRGRRSEPTFAFNRTRAAE